MTAILITDVSKAYRIRQEIIFLFPFVLLQYSHAFLLMQQHVRCDFVRALAGKENVTVCNLRTDT